MKFKSVFKTSKISKNLIINNNSVLSLYRKNIMKNKFRVLEELDDLNKMSIKFQKGKELIFKNSEQEF